MMYKVNIGYTHTGRPRNRIFATLEGAKAFCEEAFAKTGIVLSIVRVPQRVTL